MSNAPTKRGEYAKSRTRRQEILEAAFEVFAVGGYRGSSMREIAERVGMSQPGLMHHFPTKESLLVSLLELRDERTTDHINSNPPGLATIRELITHMVANQNFPGHIELFALLSAEAIAADHPAHAYFAEHYRQTLDMISASFATMSAQGQLREDVSPERLARQMVALMDGLQLQWLHDRSSLDMAVELTAWLRGISTVEF
ncbi:TetR/AcrR family transcriptional regulator [Glutamicibacter sp. NPDC087344]|uniref:TetR/AcrR family transcriptional regulator n=1 Tax=Glutamicibacter sp. NPDC087344 TaxID=3363994 RepID=UPI00380A7E3A